MENSAIHVANVSNNPGSSQGKPNCGKQAGGVAAKAPAVHADMARIAPSTTIANRNLSRPCRKRRSDPSQKAQFQHAQVNALLPDMVEIAFADGPEKDGGAATPALL